MAGPSAWSLPYGWATQGAWAAGAAAGDINAEGRNNRGDWVGPARP